MSPTTLLADLRARGVELRADGGRLRFRPMDLPADVIESLRLHKDAILDLLGVEGIPAGWTAKSWPREMMRMADACQSVQPDLAKEYREQAVALDGSKKVLRTGFPVP